MANYIDDEEELDPNDPRRKAPPQGDTIGSMPKPSPRASTAPPAMSPPEVSPDTGLPQGSPDTIGSLAPRTQPQGPGNGRMQSSALTDSMGKDLSEHPAGQPRYHGIARVADTIAQMTWPGQAAEIGGEFGTLGRRAKTDRLAHNADIENDQAKYVQEEDKSKADVARTDAQTNELDTGSELVDVDTPNGPIKMMRKNLASPTSAIINATSHEKVADTNANAQRDVAGINADSREDTARIMVNGKPMATKNIQQADGKSHVMMWNSATHTYDKDLGLAPPPASASSAFAATRTVDLIDPESGLPTKFQYDPTTGTYSKPVGVSSTGAYGHEMSQAGAVKRAGSALVNEISANKDRIGDVQALWNSAFTGTPLSDPYQSGLAAQIASFAALNPALHGARGVSAMREFEKIYGSPINNPDSLIAAIEAGMKTAGSINPLLKKESPSGPPVAGDSNAHGGGLPTPPTNNINMIWDAQRGRYVPRGK